MAALDAVRGYKSMRTAYVTLVYGDTPVACAAAVLGLTLRRHDPERERVALVRDLSNRTRAILTRDNLWRLHEVQPPPIGKRRRFTQMLMRKNELWRLPYERVLYIDADTFLLGDPPATQQLRASRLHQLWSKYGDAQLAATGVRPSLKSNTTGSSTCFNGGFLMLRPDAVVAARLDGMDAQAAMRRAEPGGRKCPGLDQPVLNRAFPPGAWRRIDERDWMSVTHWLASPAYPRTCTLDSAGALTTAADAYHFFHSAIPWENPYCAQCVALGRPCRAIVPLDVECPVQGVANRLWWTDLLSTAAVGLAPDVRQECMKLTEQWPPPPQETPEMKAVRRRRIDLKAWRADQPRLRGGMCTGCASMPTPACEWVGRSRGSREDFGPRPDRRWGDENTPVG